jgi:anti-sigma B factor antagonist
MAGVKIYEHNSPGQTIMDIEGDIIFGEGTGTLREEIRRSIREGRCNIVLNLARVRYVDSSGLGEMVSGLLAACREGGQIRLMNVSPNVQELLNVTKLATVFDVYTGTQAGAGGR